MYLKKKNFSFQENAVEVGIDCLINNKTFKLQSPTGSGKTFIISMLIEKFLENLNFSNENYTFIFIAPSTGKLDHQGYNKISNYLERKWVNGFKTEYIGTSNGKGKYLQNIDFLKKNTIYFLGWGLFGKNTNLTNIDSERNNLFRVLNNTKIKNNNIVLIIDEAHREYKKIDSNTKKLILNYINPKKIIETSATLDQCDHKITLKEVRAEAAIKKNVIINCTKDSDNFTKKGRITEIESIIFDAIKKQKQIKKEYFKKNIINIKPLILIQIPNNPIKILDSENKKIYDFYIDEVEKILIEKKYKKKFNYAIWCDGKKTTSKEEIIKNDSSIEILIFKQAISTGWDIPRANILAKIREAKSSKFIIQTLGRILRNPFHKYYENEHIDNAFVFTKDENYKSKIEVEDFVITNVKKEIKISEKGEEIKKFFKMKKIFYDDKLNIPDISENIFKKLMNNEDLIEKLIQEANEKIEYKTVKGIYETSKLEKTEELLQDIKSSKLWQPTIDYENSKYSETLFQIYLKYKTLVSKNLILNNTMQKLSNFLSKEKKLLKKKFYKFIIYKFNLSLIDEKTIFEIIGEIKNKLLKKHLKKYLKTEEFIFQDVVQLSEKIIEKKEWDKVNTYEFSLKIDSLASKNEKTFYKNLKYWFREKTHIHIFRNIEKENKSYFIEYFDKNYKKLKFFPDFILINNEYKSVLIVEIKSRKDIDKNTKFKQKQMNDLIEYISIKPFEVKFFISRNKENSNELEFLDFNDKKSGKDFDLLIEKFINGNL